MEQMRTGQTENRETRLAEGPRFFYFETSVCMALKAGQFSLFLKVTH